MKNVRFPVRMAGMVLAVFVLAGCGTTVIAYDSPVPAQETCTLLMGGFTVRKFDGQDVLWKTQSLTDLWMQVRVPAGSHTFVMDYEGASGMAGLRASDINFSHDDCKAGHTYRIYMRLMLGARAGRVTVDDLGKK